MSLLYQTDFPPETGVKRYGCYFLCLAYYGMRKGHEYTVKGLLHTWEEAMKGGILSGDLNGDGDRDDDGESVLLDPNGLCKLLDLPLKYLDGHFPITTKTEERHFVIAPWYNPRTKFKHFVVGLRRPVEYDPIRGGSVTVREGWPHSLRIFEEV